MSKWFMTQRQEFIASHLKTFGQINRTDITRKFDVTHAIASKDIGVFLEKNRGKIRYDASAKTYVLVTEGDKMTREIEQLLKQFKELSPGEAREMVEAFNDMAAKEKISHRLSYEDVTDGATTK